jgi:hypothetical protein
MNESNAAFDAEYAGIGNAGTRLICVPVKTRFVGAERARKCGRIACTRDTREVKLTVTSRWKAARSTVSGLAKSERDCVPALSMMLSIVG